MTETKQSLPEITFKAIILSIILTVVLAAANAYLGLKVGLTISASIPAAVISMACLRLFKQHNMLENNIVQTAASAGEALTAGIVFTVPALVVISFWKSFQYYQVVVIAALGGTLGVLFSVPLRRVLLADKTLPFPEGTAIGNVLKASETKGFGAANLVYGGVIGALIQIFQLGFKVLADSAQFWVVRGKFFLGAGIGFNPALIGAGYIIGVNIAICILLGIVIGWVIGMPVVGYFYGLPEAKSTYDLSMALWDQYIRYVGLGVMMIGGFWAVLVLLKPIIKGVQHSLESLAVRKGQGMQELPREERDFPINWTFYLVLATMLLILIVLRHMSSSDVFGFSTGMRWLFDSVNFFYILIGGFIFASICAYFAGLVGSSANPLSSLSLIALIFSALITMVMIGPLPKDGSGMLAIYGAAVVLIITAFVAASAAISNDTIQDLKAGQLIGATPWKQQFMLIIGVLVSSLVIPLILQLLFNAYGIAGVFPRSGMDHSQMLLAPQASLMAAMVRGIFMKDINILLLVVGGVIAVITLIADKFAEPFGFRVPVLAVGLGIYLPVGTSSSLVLGGLLSWWIKRSLDRKVMSLPEAEQNQKHTNSYQAGLLIASGLVAGAAIMGVVLAIPFVVEGTSNALRIMPATVKYIPQLLSILVTSWLFYWFKNRTVGR